MKSVRVQIQSKKIFHGGRDLKFERGRKGPACVERKLELSTGFVVGFYYHEAADLRVCQAAQSPCVSCIPSCSALLSGVNRLLEINQAPNCPSRSVESNSTTYSMLPRFFVQTPIFSVSPSSFSLSPI